MDEEVDADNRYFQAKLMFTINHTVIQLAQELVSIGDVLKIEFRQFNRLNILVK